MDIGLIISGNLTGYSWFYFSPNVKNDLSYQSVDIDFDYRNHVSFLESPEKAYILSFTPQVYSISLTSRILDSFRRPGLLTITLLVPRGYIIVDAANSPEKAAFNLLNGLNAQFFDNNFSNGMISQNLSLLMQDYYSKILNKYSLSKTRQSSVNANISQSSPVKRVGYVQTDEEVVFHYLSSPFRNSYDGFHHVVFARNVSGNIDEPPVEVVLYQVIIENTGIRLPHPVRLADRIYQLSPREGELSIEQTFTYEQVLQGLAQPAIQAVEDNQVIKLNYKFKKETRRIVFDFTESGQPIALSLVKPCMEIKTPRPSGKFNLSTEAYEFIGDEIYSNIHLSTEDSSEYQIMNGVLDVRRMRDGDIYHVLVQKRLVSTEQRYLLQFVNTRPKKVNFINILTTERILRENVCESVSVSLKGDVSHWKVSVESPYYEPAIKSLADAQQYGIHLQPIAASHNEASNNGTNRVVPPAPKPKPPRPVFSKWFFVYVVGVLAIIVSLFLIVKCLIIKGNAQNETVRVVFLEQRDSENIIDYSASNLKFEVSNKTDSIKFDEEKQELTYARKLKKGKEVLRYCIKWNDSILLKEDSIFLDAINQDLRIEIPLAEAKAEAKARAKAEARARAEAEAKAKAAEAEAEAEAAKAEAAKAEAAKANAMAALERVSAWDVSIEELENLSIQYSSFLNHIIPNENVSYRQRIEAMQRVIILLRKREMHDKTNLSEEQSKMLEVLAADGIQLISTRDNVKLMMASHTNIFKDVYSIKRCYLIIKELNSRLYTEICQKKGVNDILNNAKSSSGSSLEKNNQQNENN